MYAGASRNGALLTRRRPAWQDGALMMRSVVVLGAGGYTKLESTVRDLGKEVDDVLELSEDLEL